MKTKLTRSAAAGVLICMGCIVNLKAGGGIPGVFPEIKNCFKKTFRFSGNFFSASAVQMSETEQNGPERKLRK